MGSTLLMIPLDESIGAMDGRNGFADGWDSAKAIQEWFDIDVWDGKWWGFSGKVRPILEEGG